MNYFKNLIIKEIETGASYTLFLCNNGRIYAFGDNEHYQCGINEDEHLEYIKSPQLLPNISNINKICCGFSQNLALDIYHKLWVF